MNCVLDSSGSRMKSESVDTETDLHDHIPESVLLKAMDMKVEVVRERRMEKRKKRKTSTPTASTSTSSSLEYEWLLPLEFMRMVLQYLDLSTLLSLRLVNGSWNILVCSHLRQSDLAIIRFETGQEAYLDKLRKLLDSRIQDDIPFAAYKFTLEHGTEEYVKSFLDDIGPSITNAIFDLKSSKPLEINLLTLLETMPNLEILFVEDIANKKRVALPFVEQFPPNNMLPKLHTLAFHNEYGKEPFLKVRILLGWIDNLPALKDLQCQYRLVFECQALLFSLLSRCNKLTALAIKVDFHIPDLLNKEDLSAYSIKRNLELDLDMNDDQEPFLSNLVSNLAQVCHVCSLRFLYTTKGHFQLSDQPNLKELRIERLTKQRLLNFWQRNPPACFPVLDRVVLDFENVFFENRRKFQPIEFNTVSELQVNGNGAFDSAGNPVVPFHEIFTNVTGFGIGGILNSGHIRYIRGHFSKITTLNLSLYFAFSSKDGRNVETSSWLFTAVDHVDDAFVSQPGKSEKLFPNYNWPLWNLKALEHLEIYSDSATHIRELIIGMAKLTASRRVPSFDTLSFNGEIGDERLLFENCRWHKNVNFAPYY